MEIDAGHLSAVFPNIPLFAGEDVITDTVERIMANAAHVSLIAIADAIALVAPSDSGALIDSFRTDPASAVGGIELTGHTFVGDGIVGRLFSTLPQAVVMDSGRQPGFGVNAEGIASLAAWASRHFGVEGKAATSAAFAIATLIRQRGLPAKDYVAAAFPLAQEGVDQAFANAGEALVAALAGAAGA